MNDDFDPADSELRRRFDAARPSHEDPDPVLDSLRPRLRRAQVRHRVALGGAAVAMVAVVAVVGLAITDSGNPSVHTPPATHATVPQPGPSVTTTLPDSPTPTVDDHGGGSGDNGSSSPSGTGSSGTATGSGSSGSGDGTSSTTPADATAGASYSSAGGSITVRLADGQASLVSDTPTAGYTAEIHDNGPTRVEVRFNNGSGEWQIRVDVVNGALVPEITHSGN
jgi:hypothetical protein